MREKTDAIDYKYFIDPNLPPIKLSKEFIDDAIRTSPELAETKYLRYKSLGLSDYDSGLLVEDKATSDYFDEMIKSGVNPKLCANWLLVDIRTILKANNIDIKDSIKDNMEKLVGKIVLDCHNICDFPGVFHI